jgi:outer membrane lipoprotein LolB
LNLFQQLTVLFCCLILCACSTPTLKPNAPGQIQLQGVFGIVTPQSHESGHFIWAQDSQRQFSLELYGPLGLGATSLIEQDGVVTLETSQGKKYTASSPELLLQNNLGWSMPVQGMTYWLLGLPVPELPFQAQYDQGHRIVSLAQSGWMIQYTWGKNWVYPLRIVMQREGVRVIVALTPA